MSEKRKDNRERCLSPDKTSKNDMIKILFICHGMLPTKT